MKANIKTYFTTSHKSNNSLNRTSIKPKNPQGQWHTVRNSIYNGPNPLPFSQLKHNYFVYGRVQNRELIKKMN